MHIHGNQLNQGVDLYGLAAAKTEAQKEAERVRKKLMEGASALAGEADEGDCVVKLSGQDEPQEQASQQDEPEGGQKQAGSGSADGGEDTFSDYA